MPPRQPPRGGNRRMHAPAEPLPQQHEDKIEFLRRQVELLTRLLGQRVVNPSVNNNPPVDDNILVDDNVSSTEAIAKYPFYVSHHHGSANECTDRQISNSIFIEFHEEKDNLEEDFVNPFYSNIAPKPTPILFDERCWDCGFKVKIPEFVGNLSRGDGAIPEVEPKYDESTDEEDDDILYGDVGDFLVMRKSLLLPEHEVEEDWLRTNIFHTTCTIGEKVCNKIIDSGSCKNVVVTITMEKNEVFNLSSTRDLQEYKSDHLLVFEDSSTKTRLRSLEDMVDHEAFGSMKMKNSGFHFYDMIWDEFLERTTTAKRLLEQKLKLIELLVHDTCSTELCESSQVQRKSNQIYDYYANEFFVSIRRLLYFIRVRKRRKKGWKAMFRFLIDRVNLFQTQRRVLSNPDGLMQPQNP